MTTENGNVALLKKLFGRWNDTKGGSVDEWLEHIDENVKWRSLAQGVEGAEFTKNADKLADVRAYFTGLNDTFEMIHYTIDEYVADGETVIAIGSTAWRNRATGESFDTPKLDVFDFNDGRIIGFLEFYDTQMVFGALAGEGGA